MGIGGYASESELKDHILNNMNIDILNCKETEADVSAEFYHQCQRYGFVVKMEVRLPSKVHRSGTMRADALVFQFGEIVCAVEFKGFRKNGLNPNSRQFKAYSGLGIPFFLCCGSGEIEGTLDEVVALADLTL